MSEGVASSAGSVRVRHRDEDWLVTGDGDPFAIDPGTRITFLGVIVPACVAVWNEGETPRGPAWVKPRDLTSPVRSVPLVAVRTAAWVLARAFTPLSYPQLAALTGRTHTTVLYGVRTTLGDLARGHMDTAQAILTRRAYRLARAAGWPLITLLDELEPYNGFT